jgi:hypothetical protein
MRKPGGMNQCGDAGKSLCHGLGIANVAFEEFYLCRQRPPFATKGANMPTARYGLAHNLRTKKPASACHQ